MTLIAHTAADTSVTEAPAIYGSHPSLGRAAEADIEPMGLNCYQVSIDGVVRGFVRSTGAGWDTLVGTHLASAQSRGVRRSYAAAVRDLVQPAYFERAAA